MWDVARSDKVIYLRSAGVDLGKRFMVACVRVPNPTRPGTWLLETERFGTAPREARRLLVWLLERRVEVVVLEATSDYWRFVYYTPQPQLHLMLVNPQHLKGIRGRKTEQLVDALDGRFTDHHAWMCQHLLDQVGHFDDLLAQLDVRIGQLTADRAGDRALLETIPGIGRRAAEIILAQTGGDMAQFPTAGHLASWIGVYPGVNESAGVNKSGRTRDGNTNLKRILGISALSVSARSATKPSHRKHLTKHY